jgi:hypothetical protein
MQSDPAKRAEAALEMLGVAELPAPWHVGGVFSVPMFADFVILTDHEVVEGASELSLDGASLAIASIRTIGSQRDDIRAALTRGGDPGEAGISLGVRFAAAAFAKGAFGLGEADVTWAAFDTTGAAGDGAEQAGIAATAMLECPESARFTMVVWSTPKPLEVEGQPAPRGYPGDEEALRAILDDFPFCAPLPESTPQSPP